MASVFETVLFFLQINLRAEDTDYASFLDSFIQPARIKKLKIVQRILGNYKRKSVPVNHDRLEENIRQALEQHIEEMEPNFRSASFLRLWQELRKPLTDVIRPRKLEEMLGDLDKCKHDNVQDVYKFPYDVDNIQRDLTICKICEILVKETESSSAPDHNGSNYVYMWSLLNNPLTRCFKIARLSLLMEELAQCLPRFELAGIKYKMPSKMSEVKRDVIICKVDELLNEPFGYDGMLGSA